MSHPASHPASAPARAQLAAWTVAKQADGTVDVVIRDLINPAGQIFTFHPGQDLKAGMTARHVTVIYIRPSALPSGAGVEISASLKAGPGHELAYILMHLVRTSQRCTGS